MQSKLILATLASLSVLFTLSCSSYHTQQTTDKWVSLFNGKDINDWIVKIHHHETGENFGNTFRVDDGMIKVRYDQYGDFNEQFGHLYYKTPFSYFHLKFEYRFVAMGENCSFLYIAE